MDNKSQSPSKSVPKPKLNETTNQKKKYILVTRHGARADREEKNNCSNFYDTNLTKIGF